MANKIMVVDDDPNALRLVSYALQAEGYVVAIAASGAEALARIEGEQPDLIILDVMMPDMSGLEVCQRIRANPASARLPILILSARGLVADRVSGLKSGADDYLPKPADTSELIARVEALLGRAAHSRTVLAPAPPPKGRVLALFGAKGGVGTTTVAVNVAALLAEQGKAVCLVELRASCGIASALLKLQPVRDLGDLLATPIDEVDRGAVARSLARTANGLRLLAAPRTGEPPCELSAQHVEALTTALLQDADYVLFDLAAGWSAANQAALHQARYTAVVCGPDAISAPCAKATLATMQHWGVMGDLVGVVVVNQGTNPNPMPLPALTAALGAGITGVIPPAGDVALIAAREGIPLVTMQPQHAAAMALRELAGRLMQERIRTLA
ncbi:MAG TPA: response regulator [Anaerolineae bacterium]|mgnify:CR=1 FL=1|nr:response regulator [Anaerolineae bacterium]HOQ98690.1 response regulator [Anaerolineae bacterium]